MEDLVLVLIPPLRHLDISYVLVENGHFHSNGLQNLEGFKLTVYPLISKLSTSVTITLII